MRTIWRMFPGPSWRISPVGEPIVGEPISSHPPEAHQASPRSLCYCQTRNHDQDQCPLRAPFAPRGVEVASRLAAGLVFAFAPGRVGSF